jgi:hypothetical protein
MTSFGTIFRIPKFKSSDYTPVNTEEPTSMVQTSKADEAAIKHADEVVHNEVKRRWVSYLWDTFDKSPEERRFLFKLDAAILTFASLGKG